MKYFYLTALALVFSFITQAQMTHWAINNDLVEYQTGTSAALPTANSPDHTQNALVNPQGGLEFYAADGIIYDANGNVILIQDHDGVTPPGFSEYIFVPVPETCDEYYCITNKTLYILYSRIKKTNGVWQAQYMPVGGYTAFYEVNGCVFSRSNSNSPSIPGTNGYIPSFQNHIAATKENLVGNRYLFMNTGNCLATFEINNTDIIFLSSSPLLSYYNKFHLNNRSEIEVYEYATTSTTNNYVVATSYFSQPALTGPSNNMGGAIHLNEISIAIGSLPNYLSEYQVEIPKPVSTPSEPNLSNFLQCVNGIEFSEDGLSIFASIAYYEDLGTSGVSFADHSNVVYFNRSNLANLFTYNNVILSGTSTQDFAYGQIERGLDGKMYIAGDGRIGAWADANDPTSAFTPNAITVNNRLTKGKKYLDPNLIQYANIASMWLYLLPDQIDGEDYSVWEYGVPDLFPDVIYNCDFPYTLELPGIYHVTVTEIDGIHDILTYTSNEIPIYGYSVLHIRLNPNSECYETVVVKCCTEPGTETLCGSPITTTLNCVQGLTDPSGKVLSLCASTCTTDDPPACSYLWTFSYEDSQGQLVVVQYTGSSFCEIGIPINIYNVTNIVLFLQKTVCIPEECGGGEYVIEAEESLYFPCANNIPED